MNLLRLNKLISRKISILLLIILIASCNWNNSVINVTYEINEMRDGSFDATFSINNTSGVDLNSPWSLHWNQQSSMVDSDNLPENIIYQYVGGQYYNILSFGSKYILPKKSSLSVDIGQKGDVNRISDLPVGGFVTTNNNIIPVEFEYNWKNAKGIENLNSPSATDRYNKFISSTLLDKSELDLIVPTPRNILFNEGEVELYSYYSLTIDDNIGIEDNFVKSIFNDLIELNNNDSSEQLYKIVINQTDSLDDESYTLTINDDGINIGASDRAGALYGLQSLKQILLVSKLEKTNIKFVEIQDSPKFSYRGMLLDISRNFYGPKKIKQILDYLSFFKINHLDFRLTDDEGWRLEIPGLEELTSVGSKRAFTKDELESLIPMYGSGPDTSSTGSGYLSRSDFVDILNYAKERNILIIPQISVPSHMRSAIVSMNARYQNLLNLVIKKKQKNTY